MEDRTTLACAKHGFTAGLLEPPVEGCKDCAYVQMFTMIARRKGDKLEALDQMEDIIHALVELAEEGLLDYTAQKPEIKIETIQD